MMAAVSFGRSIIVVRSFIGAPRALLFHGAAPRRMIDLPKETAAIIEEAAARVVGER